MLLFAFGLVLVLFDVFGCVMWTEVGVVTVCGLPVFGLSEGWVFV